MLKIVGATDIGRRRAQNQDLFASKVFDGRCGYAVVCDGMGGENGGEVASSLACGDIARILTDGFRPEMDERSIKLLFTTALESANALVQEKAQNDPNLEGMGTTAVMTIVVGQEVYYAHAGDSRLYLISPKAQTVKALTTDHTVVQMMLERGEITPDEAKDHQDRHYITRAVGVAAQIEPDFGACKLEEGDILLLCSDGLYNMVSEEQFCALCLEATGKECASPFIDKANEMGGIDNITAVLLYDMGA